MGSLAGAASTPSPSPSASASASASPSPPLACAVAYRRRNPRATSLYQLLDAHYESVKGLWEERFERRYGFWRGRWDNAVARYLDCGVFENGFARVRCTRCPNEFLVAFSCKGRGLCPSCGAKRAALFSELLQHKILADVPHAQWVFSIPKMLRPYFLHHRELLGDLARLTYETVREMMGAVIDEPDTKPNRNARSRSRSRSRPGMVAVIQTFGASLKWNPHIHAVVTRGVFDDDGTWQPIPYVDAHKAELLFRHKVLRLLRDRELVTQERIDLLLSWRHSGFAVHNHTTVYPSDIEGLHRLACYLLRSPVNLSRLRYHAESKLLIYEPKAGHDHLVDEAELMEPLEFLARVLIHVPEPNTHLVRFYGAYANRVRSKNVNVARDDNDSGKEQEIKGEGEGESPPRRRALSKRWAELIYRVYEVDPLLCPCGAKMKMVAFITEPAVIQKILEHLDRKLSRPRAPPQRLEPHLQ